MLYAAHLKGGCVWWFLGLLGKTITQPSHGRCLVIGVKKNNKEKFV